MSADVMREALDAVRYEWSDGALGTASFGGGACTLFIERKDDEPMFHVIAYDVWPTALCVDPETGGLSVRIRYLTRDRQERYTLVAASSWGDKQGRNKAVQMLNDQGVQLAVDHGAHAIRALGYWAGAEGIRPQDRPSITLASRCGWYDQNRVYVQGVNVVGPGSERWEADTNSELIKRRVRSAGTFEQWHTAAGKLYNTPGLRAAVGLALLGAVLTPLDARAWGINLFGNTSLGKSTVADVVASVWGHPDDTRSQWNGTAIGLIGVAQSMDAACLVMDELGQWTGTAASLAQLAYALAEGSDRNRGRRDGSLAKRATWRTTIFSTGETSMADKLGDELRGGHGVRILDLDIKKGSWITSAQHSRDCVETARSLYGVAGAAWVEHLTRDLEVWARLRNNASIWHEERSKDATGQEDRILRHIGYLAAVLIEASNAHLVPWSAETSQEVAAWLCGQALASRSGRSSQEEYAFTRLWSEIESNMTLTPRIDAIIAGQPAPHQLWGIWVDNAKSESDDGEELWVTRETLKPLCNRLSVDAGAFIQWMLDCGHARKPAGASGRVRPPGTRSLGAIWNRHWVMLTRP